MNKDYDNDNGPCAVEQPIIHKANDLESDLYSLRKSVELISDRIIGKEGPYEKGLSERQDGLENNINRAKRTVYEIQNLADKILSRLGNDPSESPSKQIGQQIQGTSYNDSKNRY